MPQTIIQNPSSKDRKRLTADDFSRFLKDTLSPGLVQKINNYDFAYLELNRDERDMCIKAVIEKLLGTELDRSGDHRLDIWEKGWGENLSAVKEGKDSNALIPRYFDKYDIVRINREFVKVLTPDFEYQMLAMLEYWLFEKYLKEVSTIYEFGCGTGHNLIRAQEVNPSAQLMGLDWAEASQGIIAEMVTKGTLRNASGRRFDFFNPDQTLTLAPHAGVYTIAALEQVGTEHKKFIDYLLTQKPAIVVHLEPTFEVFEENHLLDYLALEYYKRRNYLWGLLTYLRELESQGKITIHNVQRTYLGHMMTEGYTALVWSPK